MSIVKKQSASRQIVDYIIEQIRLGNYKAGDRLPNERDYSEMLGVSRVSLREAISALSLLGILDARQGEGTFVSSFNEDILGQILYTYVELDKTALDDLFDIRKMLEASSILLANGRTNKEDIALVREAAQRHKEAVEQYVEKKLDAKTVFALDFNFHKALADLPKNRFASQFTSAISSSFDDYYYDVSEFTSTADNMRTAVKYHFQIVTALEKGDFEKAGKILFDHLDYLQNRIPR